MRVSLAKPVVLIIGLVFLTLSRESPGTEDPQAVFEALENRLLQAERVQVSFHVVAEGAVTVDLSGDLRVEAGNLIQLRAKGLFAGKETDVSLYAHGGQMELGNGTIHKEDSTPNELQEAILTGFTRMGILHNLARLTGGAAPDHAGGGVMEWAVVDSFGVDSKRAGGITFRITVAGRPSGSATLKIGAAGCPLERHQQVHFPSGTMTVVERYSGVRIEP